MTDKNFNTYQKEIPFTKIKMRTRHEKVVMFKSPKPKEIALCVTITLICTCSEAQTSKLLLTRRKYTSTIVRAAPLEWPEKIQNVHEEHLYFHPSPVWNSVLAFFS